MKTPREILLQRHQSAETRLDAIRRETLAGLAGNERIVISANIFRMLWQELILPARGIWASLAAIWLALLVFHWVGAGGSQPMAVAKSASRPEMFLALREQQRILAELLDPAPVSPPPARPHSQRRTVPKVA